MMKDIYSAVKEKFKDGDWVFGVGEHEGCSEAFDMDTKHPQPFSYLSSTNPDDFRLATEDEIKEIKARVLNNYRGE